MICRPVVECNCKFVLLARACIICCVDYGTGGILVTVDACSTPGAVFYTEIKVIRKANMKPCFAFCILDLYIFLINVTAVWGVALQKFESGCNGNIIKLSCPVNYKLAITRIYFGARFRPTPDSENCAPEREAASKCCERTGQECIAYDSVTTSNIKRRCQGNRECVFEGRAIAFRPRRPNCSNMTDFTSINFECIPQSSIARLCSNDRIEKEAPVYLFNAEYPNPASGVVDCECRAIVPSSTRFSLIVYAIEMYITSPQPCGYKLIISDISSGILGKEKTLPCNYKLEGFRMWYETYSSNVTFRLMNENEGGNGYVWLKVTVSDYDGPIGLYCGEDTTTPMTTTEVFTTTTLTTENPTTTSSTTFETTTSDIPDVSIGKITTSTRKTIPTIHQTKPSTMSNTTPGSQTKPFPNTDSTTIKISPSAPKDKGLSTGAQSKSCLEGCELTMGMPFGGNIAAYLRSSKIENLCQLVKDFLSCSEMNCKDNDNVEIDINYRINQAGHDILCTEHIKDILNNSTCNDQLTSMQEISTCDEYLLPKKNENETRGLVSDDRCRRKVSFLDCTENVMNDVCGKDAITKAQIILEKMFVKINEVPECKGERPTTEKNKETTKSNYGTTTEKNTETTKSNYDKNQGNAEAGTKTGGNDGASSKSMHVFLIYLIFIHISYVL